VFVNAGEPEVLLHRPSQPAELRQGEGHQAAHALRPHGCPGQRVNLQVNPKAVICNIKSN